MWWSCLFASLLMAIPARDQYLLEWKTHTLPLQPTQMERDYTRVLNDVGSENAELRGQLLCRRGALRLQLGIEGADADILEGAKLAPEDATCLFEYGKLLCRQGKAQAAKEVAESLLRIHPRRFEGHYIISHIAFLKKDYQLSLASLDAAIDVNEGVTLLHYQRGKVLFVCQRYRESERALSRAHSLGPWTVSARDRSLMYTAYAKALTMVGRSSEGLPFALSALELVPHDGEVYGGYYGALEVSCDCALGSGDQGLALRIADQFVNEFPKSEGAQVALALSAAACREFERAESALGRLKVRANGVFDARMWRLAGIVAWCADKVDDAEFAFSNALRVSPTDHDSALRLALLNVAARGDDSLEDQQRCRAAKKVIEDVIDRLAKKKWRVDKHVALLHAIVIAANGQFEDACDMIEAILKQRPDEEFADEARKLLELFKAKKRYRIIPGQPHLGDLPLTHSLHQVDLSVE